MCAEFKGRKEALLNKWIFILSEMKGDIIFLQEMHLFNIERVAEELGLKILTIDQFDGTSVLINTHKLTILENNVVKIKNSRKEPIYLGGLHLDDIPSVTHHLHHKIYKSSENIPLHTSFAEILKLSNERRVPRLKQELLRAKPYRRAIIAGDFNEPSHFDLDNVNVPVSKLFEKSGFLDSFWESNKNEKKENGHTWPASKMYKDEPGQRIDMIYTKNIKVLRSRIYDGTHSLTWISDHKMVISDVEV